MLAYHPEAQAEEFERQSRKQQLLQTQMVPVPQPYDQMLAFQQHQLMQRQLLQQQLLQQQRQLVAMHTNGGVQPPLEADPMYVVVSLLFSVESLCAISFFCFLVDVNFVTVQIYDRTGAHVGLCSSRHGNVRGGVWCWSRVRMRADCVL